MDEVGLETVKMCVDIGHVRTPEAVSVFTMPGQPREQFSIAGDRLCHVHLHDFGERDHAAPWDGGIEWVEVFEALKAIEYPGAFMFEPAAPPLSEDAVSKSGLFPKRLLEEYRKVAQGA